MERVNFKKVIPKDKNTKYKLIKLSDEIEYVTAESIWGVLHNNEVDLSKVIRIERKNIFNDRLISHNELETTEENPDAAKQNYGSFVTPEQVDNQSNSQS